MVKVDGKVIDHNMGVNDSNYIQIGAKTGIYTPTKLNTRIWLYNKPKKLMCTHFDPQGRGTIFQQLHLLGLKIPHVM
jgi:16S rRNA U516 pseudouridylate synthase RsuA-like enzyme